MALGLLGKKKTKKTQRSCYLSKVTFHFKFITLLLEAIEYRLLFPKKKFLGTKAETLAEKRAGFFAAVCLLVLFCLVNLSLKHSNGFSFLLSNQKLAPAFSSTS